MKILFISYLMYFAFSLILLFFFINDIEELERKTRINIRGFSCMSFFMFGGCIIYIIYYVYLKEKEKEIDKIERYVQNKLAQIIYRYYKYKKKFHNRCWYTKDQLEMQYKVYNNVSFLGYTTNNKIQFIINKLKEKIKYGGDYRIRFENK